MPGMRRREFVSAARRCGGGVAARGAGAAVSACWRAGQHRYDRSGLSGGIRANTAQIRVG